MKNIFLSYNQTINLEFRIINLRRLFNGDQEVRVVLDINRDVTEPPFQRKEDLINTETFDALRYTFKHSFPVKSHTDLEKNLIGPFWTLNIFIGGKCKETRSKNAILCERKRFVEKVIGQELGDILHYSVKFISDSNAPDMLLSDIGCVSQTQCEITEKTNPESELSYEKFIQDVNKFEKYQRENRFRNVKHLLIIACAQGINNKIKDHIHNHSFDSVTVITYSSLVNLYDGLRDKSILNKEKIKQILSNPGIQKPFKIYRNIITPYKPTYSLAYEMDLRRPKDNWVEDLDNKLIYIRDIEPFEVLRIIEIARQYKNDYISKGKFKEILKGKIEYICERRGFPDTTGIEDDTWLITIIQLGYLDQYGKITDKGLTLLEVFEKCRSQRSESLIRRIFGYDFLHALGVAKFLELMEKTYRHVAYKKNTQFIHSLANKLVKNGLSESHTAAKRDCRGIFVWLNQLGYLNENGELVTELIEEEWSNEWSHE